jgi:hypothetical protein
MFVCVEMCHEGSFEIINNELIDSEIVYNYLKRN